MKIFLIILIRGSMIALIATPSPAIEARIAVIFSMNDFNFDVLLVEFSSWIELNNLHFITVNNFLVKTSISKNFEIK